MISSDQTGNSAMFMQSGSENDGSENGSGSENDGSENGSGSENDGSDGESGGGTSQSG